MISASSRTHIGIITLRFARFVPYLTVAGQERVLEEPRLLDVFGLHGNGALGAHQWFAGFMAGESMFSITFRAYKEIFFACDITRTALAAKFFLRFFSHLAFSFWFS